MPAPDRAAIDWPAYLGSACGPHRAGCCMERQAGIVPFEAAMRDDPACLVFQVPNDILLLDIDHHIGRQYGAPMLHQLCVCTIIAAQLAEVISMRLMIIRE